MIEKQFNKDDLVQAFSEVCQHIADNMHNIVLSNLSPDEIIAVPVLYDASIDNIDDWWKITDENGSNNFTKFMAYLDGVEQNVEGGRNNNLETGFNELKKTQTLMIQFGNLLRSVLDQQTKETIAWKHIPHVADYADFLKESDGYKALVAKCQAMENVVAWPMVTVKSGATDLKSAFYLNVAILSTDNKPLKPKLERLPGLTH